jgi:hypothetical protein
MRKNHAPRKLAGWRRARPTTVAMITVARRHACQATGASDDTRGQS